MILGWDFIFYGREINSKAAKTQNKPLEEAFSIPQDVAVIPELLDQGGGIGSCAL